MTTIYLYIYARVRVAIIMPTCVCLCHAISMPICGYRYPIAYSHFTHAKPMPTWSLVYYLWITYAQAWLGCG